VRIFFEVIFYGSLTLLLGWFSPRIFVGTSWPARHKAVFSVLMTLAIFGAFAVYRLTTGIDATEKLEEIALCPLYSFAHCPQAIAPSIPRKSGVRTYVVFFDYGSDALVPIALQVIRVASRNAVDNGLTECLISGFEDTAEAVDRHLPKRSPVSGRRAQTV